jgi:hypothetical protein
MFFHKTSPTALTLWTINFEMPVGRFLLPSILTVQVVDCAWRMTGPIHRPLILQKNDNVNSSVNSLDKCQ